MEICAFICSFVILIGFTIPGITCLKCHSCFHVGGVYEDENCKKGQSLLKSSVVPCDNTVSTLNAREILTARAFSPGLNFHLMCLKSVIKAGDVDIAIRGCYGQPLNKVTSGSMCESPGPEFWRALREGPLARSGQNLDLSKATLQVCVCDTGDGCNFAGSLSVKNFVLGILLFMSMIL